MNAHISSLYPVARQFGWAGPVEKAVSPHLFQTLWAKGGVVVIVLTDSTHDEGILDIVRRTTDGQSFEVIGEAAHARGEAIVPNFAQTILWLQGREIA